MHLGLFIKGGPDVKLELRMGDIHSVYHMKTKSPVFAPNFLCLT